MPGSKFLDYWRVYREMCVWVVFFSAVSGVYLFAVRRSERILGYGLLGASVLTLPLMVYLWDGDDTFRSPCPDR